MPVYLKDGLVLLNGSSISVDAACCDSCCPGITLTCDSISASKSKCDYVGTFRPVLIDGTYYRDYHFDTRLTPSVVGDVAAGSQDEFYVGYDQHHLEYNSSNVLVCEWTFHTTCICQTTAGSDPSCATDCWYIYPDGTRTGCAGLGFPPSCAPNAYYLEYIARPGIQTTDDLISDTEAALPPYDNDYDDSCSALRDLSDDESTYSIQRFKPKFTITAVRGSDLVICYNEHFVPDGGGDPVDTPKTVTIPSGNTEIIGGEVFEPEENGEITITDITCCTIEGCPCLVSLGYTQVILQLSITVTLLSGTNPCPSCPGTGTLTARSTIPFTGTTCNFAAGGLYAFNPSDFDISGFNCGACGFDGFLTNWQLSISVDCDANTFDWSSVEGINFLCVGCCGNGCEMPILSQSGLPIIDTSVSAGTCEYDCGSGHFQADYDVNISFA